jgi:DNA-binding transcriptional regulator of glucitol operon
MVPEERARQGRWGRHVLLILIASLILLALGWFAVEMFGESIDAQPTQLQTAS